MKRKHPEDDLQRAVCELLSVYERQGKLKFFAVPNGERRDAATGAKLKRLGVKAGVSDLCILIPRDEGGGFTIFWELKSAKGKTSPTQALFLEWCNNAGFSGEIIRSLDDAISELRLYGIGVRKAA